ncbi:tetratricopeptide repeat protein [Actinosynnema sp. NPDC050436]|uniref:tetratricopeptide repeat protein n=1 Tax=Actinosynnema sp. NPDC050436 TaxID=3155659 RepID=UPI00340E7809
MWEQRVTEVWGRLDELSEEDFRAAVDDAVRDAPEAVAVFERAGAFDSTGHPDQAVPLYREALDLGLTGERRRRAVIQMASSLRNLGQPEIAVELLAAEQDAGSDHLDDAVRAFLALALADVGREREAVSVALAALAPHLPRYQRSVGNYARALLD